MTELEWLGGKQPEQMLKFVQDKSSDRKLRLFVCGFLRTLMRRDGYELIGATLEALETSEGFADGVYSAGELEACRARVRTEARTGNEPARLAVHYAAFLNSHRAIGGVFGGLTTATDERNKVQLLHDLWGPLPFRNLFLDSSLLTAKTVKLGQSVYEERAFVGLPMLADALEEAGCCNVDILGHCRKPGPHFRGCWVLDLILGKT